MAPLIVTAAQDVRIVAPIKAVWTHLSELNYVLRFVPEITEFEIDEEGSHASGHSELVVGPLRFPVLMVFELVDLVFERAVNFRCRIPSMDTQLDGAITMRRTAAQETLVEYTGRVVTDHKILRRLPASVLTARTEDHIFGFCENASVFINRHAEAESRLLNIEE